MQDKSFLTSIGFASVGFNCNISNAARFYGAGKIHIGNSVRIDDFCVISAGEGGIYIGDNVHIAAFCSLIGKAEIRIGDFANLSSRVAIYSSSDDYSGFSMTNPTIPDKFKAVVHASVVLEKHVIIGCGSVILPGIRLEEGCAIGALSLVNKDCAPFEIYAGNPSRRIGVRSRKLLDLENEFHQWRTKEADSEEELLTQHSIIANDE
jgi:galactoside O-acetyltransferase